MATPHYTTNSEGNFTDNAAPGDTSAETQFDDASPSAVDNTPGVVPAQVRKSSSPSKPPIWMQDYVVQSKDAKCSYPISAYVDYSHITPSYSKVLATHSTCSEPQFFSEAVTDPQWVEAIKLEIAALEENKTWSIVDLPPEKTLIGCRWIFKIKYKA